MADFLITNDREHIFSIRLNTRELAAVKEKAKAAGYPSASAFVRDLVTFNLSSSCCTFSWANWGFSAAQVEQIKDAADCACMGQLEWMRRTVLFVASNIKVLSRQFRLYE